MKPRYDFLALPNEIQVEIAKLSADIHITLPQTSKHFAALFSAALYSKEHKLALNNLRRLLNHAALGEWEDAKKLWALFPALLTCRGTVYHPNPPGITVDMNLGRYKYVNRTAWQIALMNEEYEMAEEMGKHMTEEEKQIQFAEIFPDGKIIKHHWNLKEAKKRLKAVFDEVFCDKDIWHLGYNPERMSINTRAALYTLHCYIKSASMQQTGLVFDARLYDFALQLYSKKYPSGGGTTDQYAFWCVRVEEYLAACLGTGYLRAHAQGIENPTPFTGCILRDNTSYFAFHRSPSSIPGYHFRIDRHGQPDTFGRSEWVDVGTLTMKSSSQTRIRFAELMSAKKEKRAEFMRRYAPENTLPLACIN